MIEEFDLPMEIIDRKVTKMKMISPSNRTVDVGKTMSEREYIGMCRREVFDDYLRKRAQEKGATTINGLFMGFSQDTPDSGITIRWNDYADASKKVRPPHRSPHDRPPITPVPCSLPFMPTSLCTVRLSRTRTTILPH